VDNSNRSNWKATREWLVELREDYSSAGILPTAQRLIDDILAWPGDDAERLFDDIARKSRDGMGRDLARELLEAIPFQTQEKLESAAKAYERANEIAEKMASRLEELAKLQRELEELQHAGIRITEKTNPLDLLEHAADWMKRTGSTNRYGRGEELFRSRALPEMEYAAGRTDLSYWPGASEIFESLASYYRLDFEAEPAGRAEDIALMGNIEGKLPGPFLRALWDLQRELKEAGVLTDRLTDQSMATLANLAAGRFDHNGGISSEAVKATRRRLLDRLLQYGVDSLSPEDKDFAMLIE
jgi:hypothetical protein